MTWAPNQKFILATFLVSFVLFGLSLTIDRDAIARLVALTTLSRPICSSTGILGIGRNVSDWWDCPGMLPEDERVFNKSILYVKPHKTGSESFRSILLAISDFYNLEAERKLKHLSKEEARALRRSTRYDVITRHSRYREGKTEERIRGWTEGEFEFGENGEAPRRKLIKVVTVRNPIERLFSHYFSQRRFSNFTPKRGFVKKGRLSEKQELDDFEEWLDQYAPNQQVQYLMDRPAGQGFGEDSDVILQRIEKIVEFYDHVVVADQWKQSVCLFGFTERIKPSLLKLRKANMNKAMAKRFDVKAAIANRPLFEKVLSKVKYDFILYQALFKKFSQRLDEVSDAEMQRYCARVVSEEKINA